MDEFTSLSIGLALGIAVSSDRNLTKDSANSVIHAQQTLLITSLQNGGFHETPSFSCDAQTSYYNRETSLFHSNKSPNALPTQEGFFYFNQKTGLRAESKRMDTQSMESGSVLCGSSIFEAVGDGLGQKFTDMSQPTVDCLFTQYVLLRILFFKQRLLWFMLL